MHEGSRYYYVDTVVLSNFAFAKRLSLLIARYGAQICITPAVLEEVLEGIATGYQALRDIETAVTAGKFALVSTLNDVERGIFQDLLRGLSPGEASCVACAQHRGGIVVTDDGSARNACRERQVKFTGTIGILKACCRDAMITPRDADDILQSMIDAGYFSPVRSISGIL